MSALMAESTDSAPVRSRRQVLASLLYRSRLIAGLSMMRSALVRDFASLPITGCCRSTTRMRLISIWSWSVLRSRTFASRYRLLKRRFSPIRFRDLIDAFGTGRPLPPRPVILTFDDGYDDNYRIAFPIFRELGVPATFFVSTGHIESGLPYSYDWFVYMMFRADAGRLRIANWTSIWSYLVARVRRALANEILDRMKWLDAAAQRASSLDSRRNGTCRAAGKSRLLPDDLGSVARNA